MRLQCEKDRLLTAVQIVQKATATKTTLPILTGIYLIASDGMLELQATDYEVGISITIPAEVMEPGKVVLSGKFFPEIIHQQIEFKNIVEYRNYIGKTPLNQVLYVLHVHRTLEPVTQDKRFFINQLLLVQRFDDVDIESR